MHTIKDTVLKKSKMLERSDLKRTIQTVNHLLV